jgi:hypothetical protein
MTHGILRKRVAIVAEGANKTGEPQTCNSTSWSQPFRTAVGFKPDGGIETAIRRCS